MACRLTGGGYYIDLMMAAMVDSRGWKSYKLSYKMDAYNGQSKLAGNISVYVHYNIHPDLLSYKMPESMFINASSSFVRWANIEPMYVEQLVFNGAFLF